MVNEIIFKKYSVYLETQNLAEPTIETYLKDIRYINRQGAFKSEDSFLSFILDKKKSVGDYRYSSLISALRKFNGFAKPKKLIPEWLSVEIETLKMIPKSKKRTKLDLFAYSNDQVETILNNARTTMERALFWFALKTGARLRTLLELRLSDMTEDGVTIRPETDKRQMGRYIPFSSEKNKRFVRKFLTYRNLVDSHCDNLLIGKNGYRLNFEGGMRSNTYQYHTKKGGFRVALHSCRYTFAVNVWKQSGNIYLCQYLLGHKNVQQTIDYLKIREKEMRSHVVKLMEGIDI